MRFNKLDLNLLVALDALLAERNISRAGERVHLSQPAMSNALARLREYFGDELLAAQGRQMVLTPRALGLIEPVREVLMRIDSTITNPPVFDPAKATRTFVLLLSDFTTAVFVPAMLEALYKEARGIGIELRMLSDRPIEQLEQGDADLLIIPAQYVSPDHPSEALFEEQYLCVTWLGNSRIKEELTFNDYLECGHVVANYATGQQRAAFDSWFLDRFGIKRHVEVSAPTMAALPRMVVGTDRIATVHKRLAIQAEAILPIRLWEPPLEVPTLEQKLQWHRHRDADPALTWMRELALRVGKTI
ncbi:LysR family transcriptional regulator [Acidovorax sp. 69]|uniref:LysR family transcriptional regulator n=1 Tax=Acidovorax sp. 69 TaxID=2035202 RepID=UPI000C25075F|nr:LysR family transcriptional regulator [Acidovorax sp. 69]PJI95827.1 LysR family transcriptional regulator [Acidovorax sp. 69]